MFTKARIKLTLWFLLIIMVVSACFSIVIYRFLVGEVVRFEAAQRFRIERRMAYPPGLHPIPLNEELIEETKHRILIALLLINGTILFSAGWFGFFLAGRTLSPIEEMVEKQTRFVSDASHELKTPLTALKTTFEVFLREKKPNLKDAIAVVRGSLKEVDGLQNLSQSLLDLASYEEQKLISMARVPLRPVIDEALARTQSLAAKKKIVIHVEQISVELWGNAEKLTQLFVILLDNAIKYSPEKSVVTLDINKTDRSVLVSVKDSGVGISSDDLPHIFDRFFQINSARNKTVGGGFGLGLAIAQKIVLAHKGTIGVASEIGSGSTFTVKLPA